ncbi:hypothetical protein BESB_084410 [Besnoitia besnoiti]|uniref:Dynein axonemal intermediate chain 4 n=1 Tax=Besnoitia besnoiti TaxID=94643 RepID=A0A2A9MCY5_BESBE|nr:hypothetical protein BESB_084410 [Besnoitia besnoiti]PFH33242.1 hypothetical protein BESB_084410 [Besnoitia besnoiti]
MMVEPARNVPSKAVAGDEGKRNQERHDNSSLLRVKPSAQGSANFSRSTKNISQIRKSAFTVSGNQSNIRNTKESDLVGGGQIHVLLGGKIVTPKPLVSFPCQQNGDATDVDKILEEAGQPGKEWHGDEKGGSVPNADADEDEDNNRVDDAFLYTPGGPCHAPEVGEELLETEVEITLRETATEIYFCQPGLVVVVDTEEYWRLKDRNRQYEDLAASKSLTEKYVTNHSQTFNFYQKNKEVSAVPAAPVSTGASTSPADIFDAFNSFPVPRVRELQHHWAREAQCYTEKGLRMTGSLLDVNKASAQACYHFDATLAFRRGAEWGGVVEGGTPKDVTAASFSKGSTMLRARRNDGFTTRGVSREASRKTGLAAGPSIIQGGNSTRSARRHCPSIRINEQPHAAAWIMQTAAEGDSPPLERLRWQLGKEAVLPEHLHSSLTVIERMLAQTRYHSDHMAYRSFFSESRILETADRQVDRLVTRSPSSTAGEVRRCQEEEQRARLNQKLLHAPFVHDLFPLAVQQIRGNLQTNSVEADAEPQGGDETTGVASGAAEDRDDDAGGSDKEFTDEDEETSRQPSSAASVRELFDFDGRAFTSSTSLSTMEWNPANQDLLAVAYGTSPAAQTRASSDGWILFWSLRNPLHPERRIRTPSGAVSLSFSSFNPNLLAAGMADGHVLLWDLRKPNEQPVLRSHSVLSMQASSRHTDAVWDIRWVDRGLEKVPREQLLSIGGDGKVYQWTMKKVLERTTMMSMKRAANPCALTTWASSGVDQANDSVVFMYAAGLCMDISGYDSSTYIVGTDEGLVHRCSTSYNEQYLDTYVGHTGPINRVRYNPFDSDVFSSCSDDGTVRLWNVKAAESPVATLFPSTQYSAVTDFSWFALNCPVLVVGDREGCATILRVDDEETPRYSFLEQKDRLHAALGRT